MISCSEYDHIEIVCMYNFPVSLTLKTGGEVKGTAVDTRRNTNREECIALSVDGEERLVLLDQIATMHVEVSNPHFDTVSFE